MKNRWSCATALMLVSCPVLAQSSVTIYGLISEGIGWVNNEGGAHNYKLISGPNQNNRFGFKVVEDLGGGNRAIAQLENGFDITNGKFGRAADLAVRSGDHRVRVSIRRLIASWFLRGVASLRLSIRNKAPHAQSPTCARGAERWVRACIC